MNRFILLLAVAVISMVCLFGCGGGGDNKGNILVNIDYISTLAKRPILGLIREKSDGSFSTESWVRLPSGSNLGQTLPLPREKDHDYLVVVFNDYNNNKRYDYNDYEELGIWDGYLTYEYRSWAGYGLSDGAYLFSDVTNRRLNVYTDYDRSAKAMRSTLKPRELIDKALVRIKK